MIQAMILIQLQMRKKKGIRSLNIILILTTLDIGASISDLPSLAMYGWPYFLFQIYSYSSKHLAAIISDLATIQYCPPYISQGFTVVTGGITKYLDFYCSFYSSLCNFETFKSSHCSITYREGVNARKIVFANSAGHGSHWTIINSLLPLSLLLLQPAAAQIKCGSHGHPGHHSSLHLHWVETGPGTSLDNAVCYYIYPRTFRCQNQEMF